MDRAAIVAEARTWLSTPWLHQAALKGVGTDCIGLIAGVGLALGVPEAKEFLLDPECRNYGRAPVRKALLANCARFLQVAQGMSLGDIVLLRCSGQPQHFGIISDLAPKSMVHAYFQAKRVVENTMDPNWTSNIVQVFSYRGVA
jgi:NlpC/P60 family putative phage cell wall peptidase